MQPILQQKNSATVHNNDNFSIENVGALIFFGGGNRCWQQAGFVAELGSDKSSSQEYCFACTTTNIFIENSVTISGNISFTKAAFVTATKALNQRHNPSKNIQRFLKLIKNTLTAQKFMFPLNSYSGVINNSALIVKSRKLTNSTI